MTSRFSSADRRVLRDALCAVPQFRSVRERQALIRSTFEGHSFSDDIEKVLQFLDWEGAPLAVSDDLLRMVEGHDVAPGIPALRVLAETIEPMAGMEHREKIRSLRERLGWLAQPPPQPVAPPIASKPDAAQYDVFLCHNSKDKPEVMKIADRLKQRGLRPWIDVDALQPGLRWLPKIEQQILSIPSAAVFVGPSSIGPWHDEEIDAILRKFKKDNRPVIPVMLPGAPDLALPPFLDGRIWVDFRKSAPDPMDQLVFGITGRNPRLASGA